MENVAHKINMLLIGRSLACRDKLAKVFHCSNVGEQRHEWPSGRVLAFGNSPPHITLEKVKYGRKKFEDIVNQDLSRDDLISSLMDLLRDPIR